MKIRNKKSDKFKFVVLLYQLHHWVFMVTFYPI